MRIVLLTMPASWEQDQHDFMNRRAALFRWLRIKPLVNVVPSPSLGMHSCAFMATGYPGENDEDRSLTISYVRRLARAGAYEIVMPIVTPFPGTASMHEPELQGFGEMDELCFSPVWRRDYRRLDGYRKRVYVAFYVARMLSHPLALTGQLCGSSGAGSERNRR